MNEMFVTKCLSEASENSNTCEAKSEDPPMTIKAPEAYKNCYDDEIINQWLTDTK